MAAIIEDIMLSKAADVSQAVRTLRRWGVAVIPDYFNSRQTNAICDDFAEVFELKAPLVDIVDFGNGDMAQVHRETLANAGAGFTNLLDGFCSSYARRVAQAYFEWDNENLAAARTHEQFEVEHDHREGRSCGSGLHFDRVPALKMCLYLDDTDRHNGALRVIPGSQGVGRKEALSQLRINPNPLFQKNFVIEESILQTEYVEARSGSVIFLDTYCLHGGGALSPGKRRRVIRGISWAWPLTTRYLTRESQETKAVTRAMPALHFYHPHPVPEDAQIVADALFREVEVDEQQRQDFGAGEI